MHKNKKQLNFKISKNVNETLSKKFLQCMPTHLATKYLYNRSATKSKSMAHACTRAHTHTLVLQVTHLTLQHITGCM